jgi:hypothetical protein
VYDQQYLDMKKHNSFGATDEFAQRNPLFKTTGNTHLYIWAQDDEFCAVVYDDTAPEITQNNSTLVARGLNLKAVAISSVNQKQEFETYNRSQDSANGGCATKIPAFASDAPYFDSTGYHQNAQ